VWHTGTHGNYRADGSWVRLVRHLAVDATAVFTGFGVIGAMQTDGVPPVVLYISGVVVWSNFSEYWSKSDVFVANMGFSERFTSALVHPDCDGLTKPDHMAFTNRGILFGVSRSGAYSALACGAVVVDFCAPPACCGQYQRWRSRWFTISALTNATETLRRCLVTVLNLGCSDTEFFIHGPKFQDDGVW